MHPGDGAGISYWTGRSTTDHYETLTPWWVDSWRRARARTLDTLRALYGTDPDELLEYCDRYLVTHLLINAGRYGDDYRDKARLFPPFDEPVADLLATVDLRDMVIPRVTDPSTVVYHRPPWIVLDVQRVREAVGLTAGIPATADAGSLPDH